MMIAPDLTAAFFWADTPHVRHGRPMSEAGLNPLDWNWNPTT